MLSDEDEVEYSDTELINYLNVGIRFVSGLIIRRGNAGTMLKELTVTPAGTAIPSDLFEVAGNPPIKILDDTLKSMDTSNVTINYFYIKPFVTLLTPSLPFQDIYTHLVVQQAVITALVTNDLSIDDNVKVLDRDIQLLFGGEKNG
jgi:hypothetical protein